MDRRFSCFISVLSVCEDYNEVLIPGNHLYFCDKLLIHVVTFLPVINLDEVLIPGNHLHFLVSSDEFQVLFNPFFSVTSLYEALIPGNRFYLLVPSGEFPGLTTFCLC